MNQKPLALPIKLYPQKHLMLYVICVCAFCFCVFFAEVFFDFFPTSSRRELPLFIEILAMIIMLCVTLFYIKLITSHLPNIVIYQDRLELLNPLKNTYDVFEFSHIKTIEFGYGEYPGFEIYLKNKPLLSFADKKYSLTYYKLNNTKLRSRQVADLIEQAWNNYNKNLDEPIRLHETKRTFFD
ncbi:hypothetical protein [Psychrobacter sp. I-STPA6b]|uniref:hypothetical protein n=1 Tax=Psychrobacter sp. I-STPA6b TaxID=2585718 RepID=UPI001D0C001A|nr:hypothetical protein [Psychrobacter sp. I-STPA6b]